MKKPLFILILLSFTYCSKENKTQSKSSKKDSTLSLKKEALKNSPEIGTLNKEETFKTLNDEILSTLKVKDYAKFANYIHPEKGVRFSMYTYIDPKKDKHFTKKEFNKYVSNNIKFTWGEKDGTGDKLVLSVRNYLELWVWKKDFTKAEFVLSSFKGTGNSLNNLKAVYPTQNFTENYLPGSEKYAGMDWNCLRLVFEELNGTYYLIAVINDEWTV